MLADRKLKKTSWMHITILSEPRFKMATLEKLLWIHGTEVGRQMPCASLRRKSFAASKMSKKEHKRYIQMELDRYPAIRQNKHKWVIAHSLGEIDLRKMGKMLTTEEKKLLGLQPKRFVSSAMISLVNPEILSSLDIDEALSLITANARNKYRISRLWSEMALDLYTNKLEFITANDAMSCKWCQAHNHQLLAKDFNLPRHIEQNCQCLWFRGSVKPV